MRMRRFVLQVKFSFFKMASSLKHAALQPSVLLENLNFSETKHKKFSLGFQIFALRKQQKIHWKIESMVTEEFVNIQCCFNIIHMRWEAHQNVGSKLVGGVVFVAFHDRGSRGGILHTIPSLFGKFYCTTILFLPVDKTR